MRYDPKKPRDNFSQIAKRRAEILGEYRFHKLDPIRIGGEPISMELALLLGLLIDNAAPPPNPIPAARPMETIEEAQ